MNGLQRNRSTAAPSPEMSGSSSMAGERMPRRSRKGERGQMLYIVAMMTLTTLGLSAFVIDVGHVFILYHELQASTDAAALAGAEGLPSSTAAISNANSYSSLSGDKNTFSNLSGVSMASGYPKVECLSTLQNEGIACSTSQGIYNAIQVSQTITTPTFFAGLFGISNVTLAATSTGAARGAISVPYNIAVILDQTASMSQAGSDSCTDPATGDKYTTRNQCSLVGLKTLLLNIAPCSASYTTCPSGGTNAVDMVSVFVFPDFEYNTAANAYTGSCSGFTNASAYSLPYLSSSATSYPYPTSYTFSGTAPDYQLIPFSNDYRTSDTTTTLNTSSNLVKILGSVGGSTCAGLKAPGGLKTYYAGAIAAAQGALIEEQTARGGVSSSKNAIIVLSDGAANSPDLASTYIDGGALQTASTTKYPYYNSTYTKSNQCQQGVSAVSQITSDFSTNPTTVYSVAYGATTNTSDCSTDNGNITPCQAMTQMATSPSTFFSDYTASGGDAGCTSAVQAATGLATIFGQIASDFTVARLIPNWTT